MQQTEIITFTIFVTLILVIFVVGTVLFVLQYRKRKIEHENEKTMITEIHAKELLFTQLEIQLQTMQHIGREIHDNVGQKLTLASLYTQQLAYENKAPQVTEKIENISAIINDSLHELRSLSKSLTDDVIAQNDLVMLLNAECVKVNALQKCVVAFSFNQPIIANISYQNKNILLRVVQEFLQNSIKHANCNSIKITLDKQPNLLLLHLADDGIGFDVNNVKSNGIGLSNMQKRIKLVGGKYNFYSSVGKGTSLNLEIPL
jgi:signal transduction histidine kinase